MECYTDTTFVIKTQARVGILIQKDTFNLDVGEIALEQWYMKSNYLCHWYIKENNVSYVRALIYPNIVANRFSRANYDMFIHLTNIGLFTP